MPEIWVLPLDDILALSNTLCGKNPADLQQDCSRLDYTVAEVRAFDYLGRGDKPKKEHLVQFLFAKQTRAWATPVDLPLNTRMDLLRHCRHPRPKLEVHCQCCAHKQKELVRPLTADAETTFDTRLLEVMPIVVLA